MQNPPRSPRKTAKGQSLAEYGLILALVTVFCIVALKTLGTNMGGLFDYAAAQVAAVAAGMP